MQSLGGQRRLRLLLASSSVAALLIGGGAPPALAAPCSNIVTVPFNNAGGHTTANVCVNNTSFTGNITNEGTIRSGIAFVGGTIAGQISSSGIIDGGVSLDGNSEIASPTFAAIQIAGRTFTGGISNFGTISADNFQDGINVSVSTFTGGVSNSGTITAKTGIFVVGVTTFAGGISNSGTISAGSFGIIVISVTTFAGGISNSGTISAASGIAVISDPAFAGGISNSGTITAKTGIVIGNVSTFTGGISNSGTISAGATGINVNGVSTFAGGISNSGTISAGVDYRGIFVEDIPTFAGGISNSGTVSAGRTGIIVQDISTFAGGIGNSGTISATSHFGIYVNSVTTFPGGISNSGTISAGLDGIVVESVTTFADGISNSGTISAGLDGIVVDNVSTFAGGIVNSGTITAKTGIYIDPGVAFAAGAAIVNTGTIIGSAAAINVSLATSPVTIDIEGGAINGNMLGAGLLSGDTLNFTLGAGSTFAYTGNFTNFDTVNINSGTVVLNGTDSVTTVAVNGGTLAGTGTITVANDMTINAGGTLAPGTPGTPGGTLTIDGILVFQPGSYYNIQINPTEHSLGAVIGNVTINGGTVVLTPAASLGTTYGATTFTILTSTGLIGAFNPTAVYGGSVKLSNTATVFDAGNDVEVSYLQSVSLLAPPAGATRNEQNVANGINDAILGGYTPPAQFQTLAGLSGPSLLNALTQLSGETATGAEQSAFQLTTEFLDLMLDPFVNGRGNLGGGAGEGSNPGLGFAPDQQASLPPDIALAYDEVFKAAPKQQNFDQRWGAWGSAYGGSSTTSGDPTVGSHDTSAQTYGFAAGMDYHITPHSVAGFALAGGGTGWGLSDALGSGYSQAFQFGGYGIDWFGHAYLAGALSFSNHWFTTNRTALGDQLRANFVGQSYAARLEGGYRLTPYVPWGLGVTPYGAVQFQDFHTPAYSEADLAGGGLGLSYNAMNATDVRTELGARFDDPTLFYGKPLILFGRLAWAHDFVSDPALSAVFEALPGSAFTVNGAPIPHDSALTTAGAQYFLTANWSVIGKFEGEFASGSQTYAGTGTLRYTW